MDGLPAVGPGHHALVGEMLLCLTKPGRAVIAAVRPIHPVGSLEVVGFAVRPNPLLRGADMLGTESGTLRNYGFAANRTVDTSCGSSDSGRAYELGLELTVPPHANAGTTGWEIVYRIGGRTASTAFPLGAILCSTPSLADQSCKRVWQQFGLHW
jgi:hypothetical protein